jgi:hypothetical protein
MIFQNDFFLKIRFRKIAKFLSEKLESVIGRKNLKITRLEDLMRWLPKRRRLNLAPLRSAIGMME